MRRILSAVALMAILTLLLTAPASAARTWCARDPVIAIDGQIVDIRVWSYLEMDAAATGPVQIVIAIPAGKSGKVLATDQGFGYGYAISFQASKQLKVRPDGSYQIKVAVYAPATDKTLPVRVDITPRSAFGVIATTAQGRANSWLNVQTQ